MIRKCAAGFAAAVAFAFGTAATPLMAEVTLVYSDWQLAEPVWGRSLKEAFAEFEKQNPDIKIKTEAVALGQRDTRYSTALRAGKGPDVFALDANPIKQYIKEGWVKDLTPYIAKEGPGYLADWYPQLLGPVTEGGKTYGLPKNVSPIMLTYNSELFAAAGIKAAPKTWAEFRDAAKKMTLATKSGGPVDQWGTLLVLAPAGFDLRFSVVLRGFGGDFLTPDNKHSALNSPEAKAAFNYVIELINTDKERRDDRAARIGVQSLLAAPLVAVLRHAAIVHAKFAEVTHRLVRAHFNVNAIDGLVIDCSVIADGRGRGARLSSHGIPPEFCFRWMENTQET